MLPLRTAGPGSRSSLHGGRERGLTLYELLAVIVTIFCVAVVVIAIVKLIPTRVDYRVACAGNLKDIGKLATLYAKSAGTEFFPVGEGDDPAAHESLNRLIAFHGSAGTVPPKLFMCWTWREGEAAVPDEDGKYELDAKTNSYAWTSKELSTTGPARPLASDKYYRHDDRDQLNGHEGGVNVLYTDMSVTWTPAADLSIDEGLPEGLVR